VTRVRTKRPVLGGEVLVVLLLVFAYDRIREFAATRADLAIANGHRLLSAESWMHIDIEPAMNRTLSQHHGWELLASWYYQLGFLSVTLVVLLWIYVCRPNAYRPARNSLVGINALALLVFWMVPVAPPRLIPGAGFVDSTVVTDVADKATTVSPDLYAAMPSLHVAWAVWVALQVLLVPSPRWGRWLAVSHAVLTCLAVMATANHYLLDVVAGALLAVTVVLWSRQRPQTDVGCPHVPAARGGERPADRDPAGIELRAGVARSWPARRRRRPGVLPAARP
jgi:membrane-associated phospholipid phosphatase